MPPGLNSQLPSFCTSCFSQFSSILVPPQFLLGSLTRHYSARDLCAFRLARTLLLGVRLYSSPPSLYAKARPNEAISRSEERRVGKESRFRLSRELCRI